MTVTRIYSRLDRIHGLRVLLKLMAGRRKCNSRSVDFSFWGRETEAYGLISKRVLSNDKQQFLCTAASTTNEATRLI